MILIVALMAAFAAPDFRERTTKAQLASAVTELQSSLTIARSEALRIGKYSKVKAIGSNGADFSQGWQILVPEKGSTTGEYIAAQFKSPKGLGKFQLVTTGSKEIKFRGDGRADISSDTYFCLHTKSGGKNLYRKIFITKAGQIYVATDNC